MESAINIAIFASGNGTNMEAITDYLAVRESEKIQVSLVLSDNPDAYVLQRAARKKIPTVVLSRVELNDAQVVLPLLRQYGVEYIILAGYLRLIPEFLIEAFPSRILNIHPALLPKYGGKGMYGHHVHEAVKAAGESVTGITIHEIDREYDKGRTVFQAETRLDTEAETPDSIAEKVHLLEQEHFPRVVVDWIKGKKE